MEDHRKTPNSGGNKSKNPDHRKNPKNKPEDRDFEFGSLTPSSPSQDPFSQNSPADHLFFNGRLLPHAFPPSTIRAISRTASDDSSRSNSTNSRSSSSSPTSYTPRASSCSTNSSGTDQKPSDARPPSRGKSVNTKNKDAYLWQCKRRKATELVTAQLYGSYSQRWQYITPVPGAAFKREGSVKRSGSGGGDGRGGVRVGGGRRAATRLRKKAEEKRVSRVVRWWRRLIRAVVLACRECHAMEPERLANDDVDVRRQSNCS